MVGVKGGAPPEVGCGCGGRAPLVDHGRWLGRLTPLHSQPVRWRHAGDGELAWVRALHPMCPLEDTAHLVTHTHRAI